MSLDDLAVRKATQMLEKELNHQKEKNGKLSAELKEARARLKKLEGTRPITPEEVTSRKGPLFPKYVIEAFNTLIARNYSSGSSTVSQNEVIEEILKGAKQDGKTELTREDIFKRHYLDVEDVFEEAGWEVEYDKPGYDETYEATFTFRK